ncbi:MAG: deoxyribodipyrimidine photo-lyase [Thermoplasmatota archaeon]
MEAASGEFVLYWMQASQRTLHNHALEFAIDKANHLGLPAVVFFGIAEDYPEANERHFKFMLEGLSEVREELERLGILMVVRRNEPWKGALELSREAALVVCDRGYLRHQVSWRRHLAERAECGIFEVESDVVVPVDAAADREMYSAATLRPRIHRSLDRYLAPPEHSTPLKCSIELDLPSVDLTDPVAALEGLNVDRSVRGVDWLKGGTSNALSRFREFLDTGLDRYHLDRNDPSLEIQSDMAPYLHFGQISPITLALEANEAGSPGTEAFLEELIVRRELAFNFVRYNDRYDSFDCLPNWARDTLLEHSRDIREYNYSVSELEAGGAHDPYWNAAQREMVVRGKMHNYMRMYWGKKVLEWLEDPREAYMTVLHLNNKYSLDGRDPNSYAGVAWCFGKHDRPWKERPIFGKVRYMNDNGLRRKFDIGSYVDRARSLEG